MTHCERARVELSKSLAKTASINRDVSWEVHLGTDVGNPIGARNIRAYNLCSKLPCPKEQREPFRGARQRLPSRIDKHIAVLKFSTVHHRFVQDLNIRMLSLSRSTYVIPKNICLLGDAEIRETGHGRDGLVGRDEESTA